MVEDSMAKEQNMCPGPNSDMIINLPDNVIDEILVGLPILDAVRTSVLSTKWRYKWTTITQLVFHDNQLLQSPSPNNNYNEDKLTNFIDRVLLLHSGFIRKFELSIKCLPISSFMINAWILFLSRTNIKELVLKFSANLGGEPYKLPIFLFSGLKITTLELHGCVLKKPHPTFTGFCNLKSLYLYRTTFVDKDGGFECLISKCPVLERLILISFSGLYNLNICSPNLKYLHLFGPCHDICFENTPLLSDVFINTIYFDGKVLSSLPNLRKFTLGILYLKFLTMDKIPNKLPFTCHHLDNLSLRLNFGCVNHICFTLCMLNSSPNLRQLEIEFAYPCDKFCQDIENFWEERTLIHWNMSGLQIVKITTFKGTEFDLEFIKLLLANSPILEMLSIRNRNIDIQDHKGLKFWKELLVFPCASPKAKIKFLDDRA